MVHKETALGKEEWDVFVEFFEVSQCDTHLFRLGH